MLYFCVRWICPHGEPHYLYHEAHGEAQEHVDELIAAGMHVIELWRFKMPRNKSAMVAALNDAAGVDGVELLGAQEQLVGLRHQDYQCACDDCSHEGFSAKDLN